MQQQTTTKAKEIGTMMPQWLEEKQKSAALLFQQLPEPKRDKQDIGELSLEGLSFEKIKTESKEAKTQILSCPQNIFCFTLAELSKHPEYEALFKKYFSSLLSAEENKYHALHYAAAQDILFIYVPKGVQAEGPIRLQKKGAGMQQVLVFAEPLSKVIVLAEETALPSENTGYASTFVEAFVQENAEVTYMFLQNDNQQTQVHIQKKAQVAKDGRMNWIEAYFGSSYTKSAVTATLEEEGAAATNTTIFFGEGMQKFDIMSKTIQIGKHTFADMNAIGVVADQSRAMCKGLIKITKSSFGSSGHQRIKTLLMNKEAQANAIPSMQIDNFDVRATHESSVGQISKDKVFYLMSRGLDEQYARMKIVEGYFMQITKFISDPEMMQTIRSLIYKKLKREEETEEGEELLHAFAENEEKLQEVSGVL